MPTKSSTPTEHCSTPEHLDVEEQRKALLRGRVKAHYYANRERVLAKQRVRRDAKRPALREQDKAYREANRDKILERHRVYNAANKVNERKRQLAKYGLSLEEFESMQKAQRNRCLICRSPFGTMREIRPCVDHCHKTGKVRGLLCTMCNTTIAHARDNPKILRAAIAYLKRQTE